MAETRAERRSKMSNAGILLSCSSRSRASSSSGSRSGAFWTIARRSLMRRALGAALVKQGEDGEGREGNHDEDRTAIRSGMKDSAFSKVCRAKAIRMRAKREHCSQRARHIARLAGSFAAQRTLAQDDNLIFSNLQIAPKPQFLIRTAPDASGRRRSPGDRRTGGGLRWLGRFRESFHFHPYRRSKVKISCMVIMVVLHADDLGNRDHLPCAVR